MEQTVTKTGQKNDKKNANGGLKWPKMAPQIALKFKRSQKAKRGQKRPQMAKEWQKKVTT